MIYVLAIILIVIVIASIYILSIAKKKDTQSTEKSIDTNSSLIGNSENEIPTLTEQNLEIEVRQGQKVTVDASEQAIRKIIRKYEKINPIQLSKDESTTEINAVTTNLNFGTSALNDDFDDNDENFISATASEDNSPSLDELSNITEVANSEYTVQSPNQEIYKTIDESLENMIFSQLQANASGENSDDELQNDWNNHKIKTYQQTVLQLFDDEKTNEEEKTEIITDSNKKTHIFTEEKKSINDSILDFDNFEFNEE